jgi:EAL domain-containing protein (putative c-di-GMP-specific phosphodiesterase class I)
VAALRGITSVAEWVEDLALLPRLHKLGVTYAQGYAIHMPEPLLSLETTGSPAREQMVQHSPMA